MVRVLVPWADDLAPNLGLRALYRGSAELLRRAIPNVEVVAQYYSRGSAPVNIGSPKTLLRELVLNSRGARDWMARFDLVFDTRMGDSFADHYGLDRLVAHSALAEFARLNQVPVVLGPQTIGPFQSRRGRLVASWSLNRAALVVSRDQVSGDAAASLGRPVDLVTTDVVFALPVPDPSEQLDVVVNVSGLLWEHDTHLPKSRYRETVHSLLDELSRRGREVTLLAHVLDSPYPDNDVPTVIALAAERNLRCVVPSGLDEARSLLRGARLVLGSRMHACLNAISVGTPAIPLAYTRKFAPLLDGIGWPYVVELGAADPTGGVLDLLDREAELHEQLARTRLLAEAQMAELVNTLAGFWAAERGDTRSRARLPRSS